MEESLGFIATKAQYIRMVNEVWHLKKNFKADELECINSRKRKRARDGKESGVKVGNRLLGERELQTKRSRHYVSVFEQHRRRIAQIDHKGRIKAVPNPTTDTKSLGYKELEIEPATPEGIQIFTPTPSIASPRNTDLAVSEMRNRFSTKSVVHSPQHPTSSPGALVIPLLHRYSSPSLPFEEVTGVSLSSAPKSASSHSKTLPLIASPGGKLLRHNSLQKASSELGLPDVILLPREPPPDAAKLRDIISSQVRDYLHPVALYNNMFHATPGVSFSLLFENYLEEIFEGPYESLIRASKKYPAIEEVLSHSAITDVEKWLSKIRLDLLESSQSIMEVIYFLKAYMIRLSNNIDEGFARRRIVDQLLESGIIKKHISMIEMMLQEARLRKSRRIKTSSGIFTESSDHCSTGFELVVDKFAMELLYGAARTGDLFFIRFMLQMGFLKEDAPGQQETLKHKVGTTTIQYAIEYGNVAIYDLLLRQGFDVNVPPISDFSPSLLWTAVAFDSPGLVSDLVHVHYATTESRKDFDFTTTNSSLLSYIAEIESNRKFARSGELKKYTRGITDRYKNKACTTSELPPITTAVQLSIALGKLKCFFKIMPSTLRRGKHGVLGPGGLSSLLMFALAYGQRAIAEMIAVHTLWESEVINQNTGALALLLSIKRMNILCIRALLKHGVDIDRIDPIGFRYAFPSNLIFYREFISRLRQEGFVDLTNCIEGGKSLKKLERGNGPSGNSSGPTPSLSARGIGAGCIIACIGALVENYTPNDRDIIRNQVIILSTLSKHFDISIGCDEGIYPQNSVEILAEPLDSCHAASCFKTTSQLLKDVWSTGLYTKYRRPGVHIAWDLRCEPELEKLTKKLHSGFKEPGGSVNYKEKTVDSLANTELITHVHQNPQCFVRKVWRINAEGIIEGIVTPDRNSGQYIRSFDQVIDFVRWAAPPEYQRLQCALSIEIIPQLTGIGLLSLLRLAVHCDAYEAVEAILKAHQKLKVTQEILHEAAWFTGPEIFDLVVGQYWISAEDNINEAMDFDLVLLATIIAGNLYKVVNLIPFTNIDHDYGRERTPLGIAAFLGRLDICKVLLQSGASKYISKYEKEAGEKGHFEVQTLLRMAINERGGAQSGKELTDGVEGLARLDMP
ncbi:hypothetical protein TWF970_004195 [Orbilia oligospora]|uniref:Clr5 domain-containing protein n=1 Tax=Orbilia oligospora TaxID=2813651 RepID=A0A7C8RAV2_ORBOL|nr:hypothetical protein TWF970_004195 [Orbilia oligospora]